MDCEKFESTLMDELYGELDELTSAASKRHMAGCARCASLLGGLRATRRVAVLPVLATPEGLEEKILAAAAEARKVVPLRGRFSRAVSIAGSWAMKPQTAMAAVFLLAIGGGLALVGTSKVSKSGSQSMMTITEEGSPAASTAPLAPGDSTMDLAAAANAHGPLEQERKAAAPMATATAAADLPGAVAMQDGVPTGPQDQLALNRGGKPTNGIGGGSSGGAGGSDPYGMLGAAASAAPQSAAAPAGAARAAEGSAAATTAPSGDFAAAMSAYRAKNFAESTRDFDALAGAGDDSSALWAARSVREQSGCAAAVNRFDQLAGRAYGTTPGYDATFEAGECYKSMGSFDAARARFARLLTVPSHAAKAQAELAKMTPAAHDASPKRVSPAPAQNNSAF